MNHAEQAGSALEAIRARTPLVHNITNFVSMDIAANSLLAVGASPLMAHAVEEVTDIVALANALVINIGTLSAPWIEAMRQAAEAASTGGKPWVLDPVGVGATTYRTATARALTTFRPTVIRANASEILALAGAVAEGGESTRGVDAVHGSEEAREVAARLAAEASTVVAVTGAVDYITDGRRLIQVDNGDARMVRITALGCSTSALVGAFLAVHDDPVEAAAYAVALMGVCGERAARESGGPGSLRVALIDALHTLTPSDFASEARIREHPRR
jgi:hydroxyethylthiazole kinase